MEWEEVLLFHIANHLATRANAIEVDVNFKESIWVQLNVCDSTKIMLGCVFRSPSRTPVNDDQLHTLLWRIPIAEAHLR